MEDISLSYPVKPYKLIQGFGLNPEYYAKFLDVNGNPEKGHMGLDLQAYHGQPVYAPCDGDAFYTQDKHGGDGIYIRWPNNASTRYNVILWHLCSKDDPQFKPLIKCDGSITPVKEGDLLAFADNSGAPYESSGDHLHLGLLPTDSTGGPLYPGNGYGGTIDPEPFLNGKYAQDKDLPVSPETPSPPLTEDIKQRKIWIIEQLIYWLKELYKKVVQPSSQ